MYATTDRIMDSVLSLSKVGTQSVQPEIRSRNQLREFACKARVKSPTADVTHTRRENENPTDSNLSIRND